MLAIDIFFEDLKDPKKDSFLIASLSSNNIVLATQHDGYNTTQVHEKFLEQVDSYGYAQSVSRGRYTSDAFYINRRNANHFAYEIVSKYDPESAKAFKANQEDQPIDIVFTRLEHQFKIYPYQDFNFNCADIEGKMAYMAFFGDDDDLHITRARYHEDSKKFKNLPNEPDMHGGVVVANQILMMLDDVEVE